MTVAAVLVSLALVAGAPAAAREAGAEVAAPAYFVFVYETASGFAAGRPLEELLADQRLAGHFAYMGRLREAGKLVVGGPFKDLSGAMGILWVADLEAARVIAAADPGIAAGAFTLAAVKPWHPSVTGCVEERPW